MYCAVSSNPFKSKLRKVTSSSSFHTFSLSLSLSAAFEIFSFFLLKREEERGKYLQREDKREKRRRHARAREREREREREEREERTMRGVFGIGGGRKGRGDGQGRLAVVEASAVAEGREEKREEWGLQVGGRRSRRRGTRGQQQCKGYAYELNSRDAAPLLVKRNIWQRLRTVSQRLASISSSSSSSSAATSSSSSSSVEGAKDVSAPRPGDPSLARIPEGEKIASRLRDVPVYTVTSNDNFVLLQEEDKASGATTAKPRSMLMLFMSANDAKNFKEDIVDKQSMLKPIIGTLFMDKVFNLHMQSRPKELENVALRLMPDVRQVEHAFKTYKETGMALKALPGVPIFQAEGLTMRSGDKTMIPLFFGKDELDYALKQAFGKNPVTPAVAYKRKWFARQKERVKEVAKSPFPFLYHSIWKEDDDKAKAHIKELENKQTALVQKQPKLALPKVQVGSFEDVLFRMLYEKGKEWDNVMFIPQGVSFK